MWTWMFVQMCIWKIRSSMRGWWAENPHFTWIFVRRRLMCKLNEPENVGARFRNLFYTTLQRGTCREMNLESCQSSSVNTLRVYFLLWRSPTAAVTFRSVDSVTESCSSHNTVLCSRLLIVRTTTLASAAHLAQIIFVAHWGRSLTIKH